MATEFAFDAGFSIGFEYMAEKTGVDLSLFSLLGTTTTSKRKLGATSGRGSTNKNRNKKSNEGNHPNKEKQPEKKRDGNGTGDPKKEFPLKNEKNFKDSIEDIEKQTNRKIPQNQIDLLKKDLKNNDYGELSKAKKKKHRKDFSDKKDDLIKEWEKNTGQTWPKHGELVKGKRGKILRNPTSPYDAHEIIPNQCGGPLEWYNIHPARWPNEHQGGIHRADGVWNKLFGKKGKLKTGKRGKILRNPKSP